MPLCIHPTPLCQAGENPPDPSFIFHARSLLRVRGALLVVMLGQQTYNVAVQGKSGHVVGIAPSPQ